MRLLASFAIMVGSATLVHAQDIRGVWQPVELLVTGGPDAGRHTSDIQPGLLIVTERHYAYVHVQGVVARAPLESNPSREARCSAWEPFVAHAGTYMVTDSTFSVESVVAKNPGVRRSTSRLRVVADSLWFFFREPRDDSERRLKWVRVERTPRG